jgi:hypothetical protein
LVWLIGLMWVLNRKGIVTTSRSDTHRTYGGASNAGNAVSRYGGAWPGQEVEIESDEEEVSEIVVKTGPSEEELAEQARLAALATATETPEEPEEDVGPPRYPVWFESERNIGVCKISWEGGGRTANLHVSTRLPEGRLKFSYRCGNYRGRGSIDVRPNRVNGVLFCKRSGAVKVKTVRSKDSRCGRR